MDHGTVRQNDRTRFGHSPLVLWQKFNDLLPDLSLPLERRQSHIRRRSSSDPETPDEFSCPAEKDRTGFIRLAAERDDIIKFLVNSSSPHMLQYQYPALSSRQLPGINKRRLGSGGKGLKLPCEVMIDKPSHRSGAILANKRTFSSFSPSEDVISIPIPREHPPKIMFR